VRFNILDLVIFKTKDFLLKREIEEIAKSELFDVVWYCERNGLNLDYHEAIEHYCRVGSDRGWPPHPLFNLEWYRNQTKGSVRKALTDLGDYIVRSRGKPCSPNPLFDAAWYSEHNPECKDRDRIPFRDYIKRGAAEGCQGHWAFDGHGYLVNNSELAAAGINPLTHFLGAGEREGRLANPFFDSAWYWREYERTVSQNESALVHFITKGAHLGFKPAPYVDLEAYAAEHDEINGLDVLSIYRHLLTADPARYLARFGVKENNVHLPVGFGGNYRPLVAETIDLEQSLIPKLVEVAPIPPIEPEVTDDFLVPSGVKILSLDVWDTLLRRNCHPDEIKLQSARYLWLVAQDEIRPAYRNLKSLYAARLVAENSSSPNGDFEYRFSDAVVIWLDNVLERGVSSNRRSYLCKQLLNHEESAESRVIHADQWMQDNLSRHHITTAFCSDFYMDSGFIAKLLSSAGMGRIAHHGYVSSEYFENKRSGSLFHRLLREHEVEPDEVLHIGDNLHADINVPGNLGLKTYHYLHGGYEERRRWYEAALSNFLNGNGGLHRSRITLLVEEAVSAAHNLSSDLASVAKRLAPLFVGFILSIIEDATKRNVDAVYFFSREGIFFRNIYDEIIKFDPFNLQQYPKSKLLEVSRRATFAASVDIADKTEWMRIWRMYSSQSLRAFCESINIPAKSYEAIAEAHKLDPDAVLRYPWQNAEFQALFEDKKFQKILHAACTEQRRALLGYLEQMEFEPAANKLRLIVDIGWRGTIHDNIAKLCNGHVRGHYLGLFTFLNPQESNVTKLGWLFDENSDAHGSWIGDVAPFEMISNGSGGSVFGYTQEADGRWSAQKVIFQGEEAVITDRIQPLQEAMLSVVGPITDYIRRHGLTSEILHELSVTIAASLSVKPPQVIVDAFFDLEHNETFGVGIVEDMGQTGDLLTESFGKSGAEFHATMANVLQNVRWEAAFRQSSHWTKALKGLTPEQMLALPLSLSAAPSIVRAVGAKVAIFAPPPLAGSGGHRTIFNVVRRLEEFGFEPHIYVEGYGEGLNVVEHYLQGTPAFIHSRWESGVSCDFALATIAQSAQFVAGLKNPHYKGYLVQDFEAAFNPLSDAYVVCENSYTYGLHHLTIGNWLTHLLSMQFGAAATPAGLGVDTSIYHVDPDVTKEEAVCFLYQPEKMRRTPVLGIDALRIVKKTRPDVKIYVYGSDRPIALDFEVENLGVIRDLNDLNRLYNKCKVGLCISMSNPSRIPFEMMAAGCIPVDVYRYNNLFDHENASTVLAFQSSESISAAILEIFSEDRVAAARSMAGMHSCQFRTLDWENDVIANAIAGLIQGQSLSATGVKPTYTAPPLLAEKEQQRPEVSAFCNWQRQLAGKSRYVASAKARSK